MCVKLNKHLSVEMRVFNCILQSDLFFSAVSQNLSHSHGSKTTFIVFLNSKNTLLTLQIKQMSNEDHKENVYFKMFMMLTMLFNLPLK